MTSPPDSPNNTGRLDKRDIYNIMKGGYPWKDHNSDGLSATGVSPHTFSVGEMEKLRSSI